MSENYRVQVYMVGVDKELAKQLKHSLSMLIKGVGNERLKAMLREAYEGGRVLIYETNDDKDALSVANGISKSGATIEIDGLSDDDDPF